MQSQSSPCKWEQAGFQGWAARLVPSQRLATACAPTEPVVRRGGWERHGRALVFGLGRHWQAKRKRRGRAAGGIACEREEPPARKVRDRCSRRQGRGGSKGHASNCNPP